MTTITSINECLPVIHELKESLHILKDYYKINDKDLDIMYYNANSVCEYTLDYFHIHRSEHMKVAETMLYVHNEYFKWACNEIAEELANIKLDEPDSDFEMKVEGMEYLRPDDVKYVSHTIFKNIKPDNWVEGLEAKLRGEVYGKKTN